MTFQFKIQLLEIKSPAVWRSVLVPGKFTFHNFHRVIQVLFGWYDYHLYEFSPEGLGSYPIIAHPDSMPEDEYTDSEKYKLNKYFSSKGEQLIYTYDYGDCWEHQIILEKISKEILNQAIFIGGAGAPPPEDCGGVMGFKDFKLAVNNPKHKEYKEIRQWACLSEGELWDVQEVDKETIIDRLEKI